MLDCCTKPKPNQIDPIKGDRSFEVCDLLIIAVLFLIPPTKKSVEQYNSGVSDSCGLDCHRNCRFSECRVLIVNKGEQLINETCINEALVYYETLC